jgi:hypothetical protein
LPVSDSFIGSCLRLLATKKRIAKTINKDPQTINTFFLELDLFQKTVKPGRISPIVKRIADIHRPIKAIELNVSIKNRFVIFLVYGIQAEQLFHGVRPLAKKHLGHAR